MPASVCSEGVLGVHRRKDTALHWAAYKGHAEVVQALLQAGANPVGNSNLTHLYTCHPTAFLFVTTLASRSAPSEPTQPHMFVLHNTHGIQID